MMSYTMRTNAYRQIELYCGACEQAVKVWDNSSPPLEEVNREAEEHQRTHIKERGTSEKILLRGPLPGDPRLA